MRPHAPILKTRMKTLCLSTLGLLAVLLAGIATGCSWSIGATKGDTSSTPATVSQPTQGQELIDLKKAHEQGALSDEEYEKARQRILGR